MYIRGVDRFSAQWLCSPRVHRHTSPSNGGENAQCIGSRLFKGGISVDCAYAEKAQLMVTGGKENGEGILRAFLARRRTG